MEGEEGWLFMEFVVEGCGVGGMWVGVWQWVRVREKNDIGGKGI